MFKPKQLLSVLSLCLYASSPAIAQQFNSKVQIPHQVEPDESLRAFISDLKEFTAEKDLTAISRNVSEDFYLSRDFGGVFDPAKSGSDNFIEILSLDDSKLAQDYVGSGWKMLESLLQNESYQMVEGDVCAPANAEPVKQTLPDEFWLSWSYVNGSDVFVRSKPSLSAEPLTSLSFEAFEPSTGIKGDRVKGLDGEGLWIELSLSGGQKGYIYSSYVENFQLAQVCYRKQENDWQIVSYVGGGD